ncbi:replication protein [Beggiatoa sp. PS]|nr:replication protein [Beggiatoa sp. PS]
MTEINPVVLEIGRIHFEGNVIPHEWFQHIKMSSGNADAIGTLLLADIIYWYRPIKQISEITGKTLPPQKKFKADMFQASASYYHSKFGFTKKQVRDALKRLEDNGYIRREYRTIKTKDGITLNNVMFIEPIPTKIMEITHPNTLLLQSETLSPQSDRVSPQSETYTETSTETSTNIHTQGKNENLPKKSVCVLEELNDFEKAAWEWAQSHDFWKGRITTLKQLKANFKDNKRLECNLNKRGPLSNRSMAKKLRVCGKR